MGIGQHNADRLTFAGSRNELPAEHARADKKLAIAELAGDGVLDRDAAPALDLCCVDHGLDDRAVRRRRAEDQVGHDLIEHRPRRLTTRLALESILDSKTHRLEHGDPDFGKPAPPDLVAAEPRENRSLQALDTTWRDHHIR